MVAARATSPLPESTLPRGRLERTSALLLMFQLHGIVRRNPVSDKYRVHNVDRFGHWL